MLAPAQAHGDVWEDNVDLLDPHSQLRVSRRAQYYCLDISDLQWRQVILEFRWMQHLEGDEQELVGSKGNLGKTLNSAKSLLSFNQFLFVP